MGLNRGAFFCVVILLLDFGLVSSVTFASDRLEHAAIDSVLNII